jgi:hypothetical protein
VLGGVLLVGLIGFAIVASPRRRSGAAVPTPRLDKAQRETWTMPQLAFLGRPTMSRPVKLAMWTLRIYLVISVLLLIVKAVQLGTK